MSRLGEQNYNLLFNNCEHFANWCKTGRHRSNQMDDWLKKSTLGAMAFGQIIPAAFFTGLKLLLKQGIQDEFSRQKAKQAVNHLETFRKKILHQLQATLDEIENWLTADANTKSTNKQIKKTLLLKGQDLEDQLNSLEHVEAQILTLLNQSNPKK